MSYLDPSHSDPAELWLDFPEKRDVPTGHVSCPKCHGHGGWNLKIAAYAAFMQGKEDTAENRHKFLHFRSSCGQCNGWGFVRANSKSATCIHTWTHKNVGRCLHEYTCTECGTKQLVDSSD